MSDRIPLKVRLIAAGLHGILPGSIGSFLIFLISLFINISSQANPNPELIVLSNLICGLLLILLLPIIIWICWLIVSRIHPTIDLAGKDAINCALNNLIVILSRLSRLSGDKYCLFKWLEQSENHLNKQANNFSFIRSKFLNP